MLYSEYLNLMVSDGSSTVLSDIPARADHDEWMGLALTEGAAAGSVARFPSVLSSWTSKGRSLLLPATLESGNTTPAPTRR